MPRTAHRVSLIERVTEVLDRAKASYAVIGAAAMAARGVEQKGERPVDLVFGRYRWQQRVLARAQPAAIGGLNLPTVQTSDLILLKLYAGGAQDAWDIEQLLAGPDRGVLIADVEAVVVELPARCRRLWKAVLDPRP